MANGTTIVVAISPLFYVCRVVESVNTSVTVGQLVRHMQALNPANYTGLIMAGTPPTPVKADMEATLEEAGLLNTVIIQQ
jgi:hypothetical protein